MEDLKKLEKREHARHSLIGQIQVMIDDNDYEKGERKALYLGLIVAIADYLGGQGTIFLNMKVDAREYQTQQGYVENMILPKVKSFTLVEREQSLILATLLEWVTKRFTQQFHADFLELTFHKRQEFLEQIE